MTASGRKCVSPGANEILSASHLRKSFHAPAQLWARAGRNGTTGRSTATAAVDDVTLGVCRGETLAIVGESGSGKTTLARVLLRLIEPDSGEIRFEDHDFLAARGPALRLMRRQMQMIFQDPYSSLDPRMRIDAILGEPLDIYHPEWGRAERRSKVEEALTAVGLDISCAKRFPHEFSGGQRQRIGIARALVLRPKLVVADEPVSALDVSVGAQVIELLRKLQADFGLTYIVISHSLPIVAQLATTVAVMQAGKVVEMGPAEIILKSPQHPYTQALLAAVPSIPAYA